MDGRDDRDEGMKSAMDNERKEWHAKALTAVLSVPHGWEGLFEEVRIHMTNRGVPQPHVYQVWSAFANKCIREGLFERVEEGGNYRSWDQPKSRASHASSYRKLRRL